MNSNFDNRANMPMGSTDISNMNMENAPSAGVRRQFDTPIQQTFDTEEMRGSMQKILADNIGAYVVVEFLIGTERMTRKQGILYFVGTSFVTLYDDMSNIYIVCDIFSIKFVYFYYPGQRPNRNYNLLPSANVNM